MFAPFKTTLRNAAGPRRTPGVRMLSPTVGAVRSFIEGKIAAIPITSGLLNKVSAAIFTLPDGIPRNDFFGSAFWTRGTIFW